MAKSRNEKGSIGRSRIKKLKQLICDEVSRACAKDGCAPDQIRFAYVADSIWRQVPKYWLKIWKLAFIEIRYIIDGELLKYGTGVDCLCGISE